MIISVSQLSWWSSSSRCLHCPLRWLLILPSFSFQPSDQSRDHPDSSWQQSKSLTGQDGLRYLKLVPDFPKRNLSLPVFKCCHFLLFMLFILVRLLKYSAKTTVFIQDNEILYGTSRDTQISNKKNHKAIAQTERMQL